MKSSFLGLTAYLKKPIYPLYLICGDEPYQTDHAYRSILKKAVNDKLEIEKLFFENSIDVEKVYSDQSNLSLFSQIKLVVLQFNKVPDKKTQKTFDDLFDPSHQPKDKIYLIKTPKLSYAIQNSKWYNFVLEKGLIVQIWEPNKYKDAIQLILYMLNTNHITADQSAIDLIIEKTEGNLFSASQLIQSFSSVSSKNHMLLADIQTYIENTCQFSIYDLISAWLNHQTKRINSIVLFLQDQNPELNLLIWNIARTTRILIELNRINPEDRDMFFKKNKIFKMQQLMYINANNRFNKINLYSLLSQLARLDVSIKTSPESTQHWLKINELLIN
ncbi:MAG: DNA polymerase-3 subunit delta [Francisellaceae bacterium]|jgi:DNA polymerase-3 subunit delta